MSESHPTQVLRDEHQWILAVAEALERLLGAPPSAMDFDTVEKCVTFIRLFADACHHGKEEDLLFPVLEEQGMPRDSGPIAVMLHEHRLGREAAAAMRKALPGARDGDEDDRLRLVHAGRSYIDLIRGHIGKEDHVLFNMADQMVSGETRVRLCAAYDETCSHAFEGCTKAQLEALGREIVGHPGR
ncbi:MAG: hemerythrin domain-containing protein [Gemmatimonadales bacterium]|jgi:hemerythrin-like domain-containing protein|nr:MAG: hemerythrin domain-containing protein [Gemmatimonadales bacterium]